MADYYLALHDMEMMLNQSGADDPRQMQKVKEVIVQRIHGDKVNYDASESILVSRVRRAGVPFAESYYKYCDPDASTETV
jgi:hypothetical protein